MTSTPAFHVAVVQPRARVIAAGRELHDGEFGAVLRSGGVREQHERGPSRAASRSAPRVLSSRGPGEAAYRAALVLLAPTNTLALLKNGPGEAAYVN